MWEVTLCRGISRILKRGAIDDLEIPAPQKYNKGGVEPIDTFTSFLLNQQLPLFFCLTKIMMFSKGSGWDPRYLEEIISYVSVSFFQKRDPG